MLMIPILCSSYRRDKGQEQVIFESADELYCPGSNHTIADEFNPDEFCSQALETAIEMF
jgi:hypothetical protein